MVPSCTAMDILKYLSKKSARSRAPVDSANANTQLDTGNFRISILTHHHEWAVPIQYNDGSSLARFGTANQANRFGREEFRPAWSSHNAKNQRIIRLE